MLDLTGGTVTLRDLGRVIAEADVFVGGNTRPLHLAAAVGAPTVAFFPLEGRSTTGILRVASAAG